jgi:hypothetical protein
MIKDNKAWINGMPEDHMINVVSSLHSPLLENWNEEYKTKQNKKYQPRDNPKNGRKSL